MCAHMVMLAVCLAHRLREKGHEIGPLMAKLGQYGLVTTPKVVNVNDPRL
jgi:hypothetical protein